MPNTSGARQSPPEFLLGAPTKADATYMELRRQIVEGELPAGSRIDQELIAATYGVSTTPLRESLRRLEVERLVDRTAHREIIVAPLSITDAVQLYAVRIHLDLLATSIAAQLITDEEVMTLREVLLADETQLSTRERYLANRVFHRTIYRCSRNKVLIDVLDRLWDRADRYRFALIGTERFMEATQREHEQILDAIAARDEATSLALMEEHLSSSRDEVLRWVSQHYGDDS